MRYRQFNKKSVFRFDKRYLLVLALIVIIVLAFFNVNNTSKDGLKYNKNKSFLKTQTVKGIVFKNIKCTFDGKDSNISYTMINETNKKIYLNNYDVEVQDKDHNRLTKIAAHFSDTLEPKKSLDRVDRVVGVDLTDAYYMALKLNTKKKDK